jgi:hypothetical protein
MLILPTGSLEFLFTYLSFTRIRAVEVTEFLNRSDNVIVAYYLPTLSPPVTVMSRLRSVEPNRRKGKANDNGKEKGITSCKKFNWLE